MKNANYVSKTMYTLSKIKRVFKIPKHLKKKKIKKKKERRTDKTLTKCLYQWEVVGKRSLKPVENRNPQLKLV